MTYTIKEYYKMDLLEPVKLEYLKNQAKIIIEKLHDISENIQHQKETSFEFQNR
jgi:hypothetical protein